MKKITVSYLRWRLSQQLLVSFIKFVNHTELGLNATIPLASEKMKDVSGKFISLNEVKTKKGLLVIFSCNTCPYVKHK